MYSNYFITEMCQGFMPLLTHMIVNYCTYITVKPANLRARTHTHINTRTYINLRNRVLFDEVFAKLKEQYSIKLARCHIRKLESL